MRMIISIIALIALLPTAALAQKSEPTVVLKGRPVPTQHSKVQTNADIEISIDPGVNDTGAQLVYEVPGAQRLVIETVSVWTGATDCGFYMTPSLTTTAGGNASVFRLPVPDRTFSQEGAFYLHSLTLPVKLYADPGTSVFANILRSDAECGATARVSVSGYLENDK